MNNVENNNNNGKNQSLSLQIPYMYSGDTALGLSKWKAFHFISIVKNDGNGFNWNNPTQLGLSREQAAVLLDNSIMLFNALYPEAKLELPYLTYREGAILDVTQMTHLHTPIGYLNKNNVWTETGGMVVGYTVAEAGNFVFGLSIRSNRNGEVTEAFFPFPYRPITSEVQDANGNVLNKIGYVQLEFLGFVEMLHSLVYGPSRLTEVGIKKVVSLMIGGANKGGGNSNNNGGSQKYQNNKSYGGEDEIPFF